MNPQETLRAELAALEAQAAEKRAKLDAMESEPDWEAWRPALEAYADAADFGDASSPLDWLDKRRIVGLQAALPLAPAAPVDEAKGSDWFNGDVDCDGNELVTIRADELQKLKDEREKFMWQVRDTCVRAEKAERELATLRGVQWPSEELRDMIAAAYHAGATDVHSAWEKGIQGAAADLGEGASDYAANVLAQVLP